MNRLNLYRVTGTLAPSSAYTLTRLLGLGSRGFARTSGAAPDTRSNGESHPMPFLILAYDHTNMHAERERVRESHRAHLASIGGRLLASGAILGEDGKTIIGGASLVDLETLEEARRFESEDPYAKAGIRKSVTVLTWRLRWWSGVFDPNGHRPGILPKERSFESGSS